MSEEPIKVYGYRWIILIVFSLIQFGIQIIWSTFLPITSEAAEYYHVTPLAIGFLSMMFMLVYIFVSLPSSWAISNLGVRKAVGFAVALMGVFGMIRGLFGESYQVVLICTVILSIAQPFIINAITTMSARWFPIDERATATGVATLAQLAGIMAGMATTPILSHAIGIKPTLIAYGVLSLVIFGLFLLLYRERPQTPPSLVAEIEEIPHMREGIRIVFSNKNAILLLIIFCGGMVAFNSVSTWIEQIVAPRGFDTVDAGSLGAVMILGGVIGCIVLPIISDKTLKRKLYVLIGSVVIIPGMLGITFLDSFSLLLTAGAILGFFQLGLSPIIMEALADVCRPATEATTQGVLWMFGQGLSVIGILLMDSFRSESGTMTPLMLVFVTIIIINFGLTLFLDDSQLISKNNNL